METIQKIINENADSIALGSASKSALLKIYGSFDDVDAFKVKIDNAAEVKKYAQSNLMINI